MVESSRIVLSAIIFPRVMVVPFSLSWFLWCSLIVYFETKVDKFFKRVWEVDLFFLKKVVFFCDSLIFAFFWWLSYGH